MRRLMLGLAFGLAACSGAPNGGGAPPVAIRAQPTKGVAQPAASGEASLVVRAVSPQAPGQEIAGATCSARSPYFTASFTPPTRLLVPDFGPQAPSISIACEAGGARGSAVVEPEVAWSSGSSGGYGIPAIGVAVGTGNNSGVGVGFSWWGSPGNTSVGSAVTRYPDVRIPLQ